jgi:hypothetical protein
MCIQYCAYVGIERVQYEKRATKKTNESKTLGATNVNLYLNEAKSFSHAKTEGSVIDPDENRSLGGIYHD